MCWCFFLSPVCFLSCEEDCFCLILCLSGEGEVFFWCLVFSERRLHCMDRLVWQNLGWIETCICSRWFFWGLRIFLFFLNTYLLLKQIQGNVFTWSIVLNQRLAASLLGSIDSSMKSQWFFFNTPDHGVCVFFFFFCCFLVLAALPCCCPWPFAAIPAVIPGSAVWGPWSWNLTVWSLRPKRVVVWNGASGEVVKSWFCLRLKVMFSLFCFFLYVDLLEMFVFLIRVLNPNNPKALQIGISL